MSSVHEAHKGELNCLLFKEVEGNNYSTLLKTEMDKFGNILKGGTFFIFMFVCFYSDPCVY